MKISKNNWIRRRVRKLWAEDPHCRLCGRRTVLVDDLARLHRVKLHLACEIPREAQEQMATLDHLVNRFEPARQVKEGKVRTRLVCRKCNNERGNRDYRSLPVEVRRQMSWHGHARGGAP